jgi:chromate transporter
MPRANFRDLLWIFLRIGNTTIGGGELTMVVLQRELQRREWLSVDQFGIAYALARLTPGTNVVAFCAASGYTMLGLAGAVGAVLASTIPSSILVVWLTELCAAGDRIPWLGAMVSMTIAAVVGLMVAVALKLAASQMKGQQIRGASIFAGAFLLRTAGLSPLQTLLVAAVAGLLWRQP